MKNLSIKVNLAYVERKHCCFFAEHFMEKNLYSGKYDKSNMKVFTLSLWEILLWGLIYETTSLHEYNFNPLYLGNP